MVPGNLHDGPSRSSTTACTMVVILSFISGSCKLDSSLLGRLCSYNNAVALTVVLTVARQVGMLAVALIYQATGKLVLLV